MDKLLFKIGGYFVLSLAVILGPGTLFGFWIFLYTGPFSPIRLNLDEPSTLMLDGALSLLFFIQHSTMVRPFFRQWLARYLPESFYGPLYAIASGISLLLILLFWQESSTVLVTAEPPLYWVFRAGYFVSLTGFFWCIWALGLADPFGLTPLVEDLRGTPAAAVTFTIRGPYRWVRHPVYLFSIIILWSYPTITSDRLLLNSMWTVWIIIATVLEERNMTAAFGKTYQDYQNSVPMLVPYKMPIKKS